MTPAASAHDANESIDFAKHAIGPSLLQMPVHPSYTSPAALPAASDPIVSECATAATASSTHPPSTSTLNSRNPCATSSPKHPRPPQPDHSSRVISPNIASLNKEERSIFVADVRIEVYRLPSIKEGDLQYGIVMYDSGCEHDLISTAYIAERQKPADARSKTQFAMPITGAPYDSIGEVRIRWQDNKLSTYRYMSTICLIVESCFFDVIIGWRTLRRLDPFVRNLALARPVPPYVTGHGRKAGSGREGARATRALKRDDITHRHFTIYDLLPCFEISKR
jgi:hypothetical protein